MSIDERLVKKGKGEPREGLAQQGKVQVELAKKFATGLSENGWSASDTAAFESDVAFLDSSIATQAEAKLTASAANAAESDGVDAAKDFLERLRNALPRALREANVPGLTMASFSAGKPLGRSVPKLSTYLTTIRPAVAKIDAQLVKHFKGKKGTELLDAVKAALDSADVNQEVTSMSLPKDTLLIYETKGRVLEKIEDMNRAAKNTFAKEPETRALFNKDILDRARSERAAKAKPPTKPGKPSQETAPTQPGKEATPAPSGQEAAPAQPGKEVVPARSGKEAAPAASSKEAAPAASSKEAAPVQPSKEAAPVQPSKEAAPVQPSQAIAAG